MDRHLVISSDGHAGPRPEVYRDYLDPKYRDAFDVQHAARLEGLAEAGAFLEMDRESARWAAGKEWGLAGAWDSDRRNEILDADGVVRYAHRATAGLTFRPVDELVEAIEAID